MKNLSILLFLLISQLCFGQQKTQALFHFGTLTTASKASVAQLLDYPKLLCNDKSNKINSYTFEINTDAQSPQRFTISGAVLSQEAKNALKHLNAGSVQISIYNIVYTHQNNTINAQERIELSIAP